MEVISGYQQVAGLKNTVVTIGNFDGVHRGHQSIIEEARRQASALNAKTVVYTFKPHPRVVLNPAQPVGLLTTYPERLCLFEKAGADVVVEEPFSREFSSLSAQDFFLQVLIQRLSAKAIVVGHDFGFGRERKGQLDLLKTLCADHGVKLTIIPPFKMNDQVISSSKIRSELLQGEVQGAHYFLGYAFSYEGVVIRGESRGSKIGFPTANLKTDSDKIMLPYGVYATRVILPGTHQRCLSVTNIGIRPTFNASETPLIETHLLDWQGDLYGLNIRVEFISKLRDEKKFPSIEALKNQITLDVEIARKAGHILPA